MSPRITSLRWDSEFFGTSIASTSLTGEGLGDAVREAKSQNVECLYVIVDGAHPAAITDAVRHGGRLVDLRMELELRHPLPPSKGFRRAEAHELPALLPLAEGLAAASRFSADARFAHDAVREMYRVWLERCLDEGLVVVPDRGLGGFVGALPLDAETISIDLVYVSETYRGQRLASKLVRGAVAASGARTARVVTQLWNIAAQRSYQNVGFRTTSTQAILHLWLDHSVSRAT